MRSSATTTAMKALLALFPAHASVGHVLAYLGSQAPVTSPNDVVIACAYPISHWQLTDNLRAAGVACRRAYALIYEAERLGLITRGERRRLHQRPMVWNLTPTGQSLVDNHRRGVPWRCPCCGNQAAGPFDESERGVTSSAPG